MLRAAVASRAVCGVLRRPALSHARLRLGVLPAIGQRRSLATDLSALSGTSLNALDTIYAQWLQDPSSVNASMRELCEQVHNEPAVDTSTLKSIADPSALVGSGFSVDETLRLLTLSRVFRSRGHLMANLDPLELGPKNQDMAPFLYIHDLDFKHYGFNDADLDRSFYVGSEFQEGPVMTLRAVLAKLRKTYCSDIGFEFRHLMSKEQKDWIESQVEDPNFRSLTREQKKRILTDLAKADLFETFLAKKWPSVKRFGLEGGESTIVGMQAILEHGSELGLENVVIGMAHRGRLNVLGNVVGKPLENIFSEFNPPDPSQTEGIVEGTGDVKYHLGTSNVVTLPNGRRVKLTLTANPSHLEAVNPVVVGKTRAKQLFLKDENRTKVMAMVIHGDAAFAGQGVVAETFALNDLHNYTVGGVVHIVINNQIGFTTNPSKARSSPYPSDIAKMIGAPIFHVNGDNPEAVAVACRLAIEYRMRYHDDVVVDIFCYRRHGHNESDEAAFTQPLMYQKIKTHPTTLTLYANRLREEGSIGLPEIDGVIDDINKDLGEKYVTPPKPNPDGRSEWLENFWANIKTMRARHAEVYPTRIDQAILEKVGKAICTVPEDFTLHRGVKRVIQHRAQMFETGQGFDWGTAEALAFGSLLDEGHHVRLSGQDCERGTFSHRHALITDQKTERPFVPLHHVDPAQGHFSVCNSSLSEFACLGFELGYSLEHPNSLVLWEAQFGDFANGAQIMIDNFICAGEQKWLRQTGLTMLLPHGYDGQGPEHSSARLERFLQLCDDDPDHFPHPDLVHRQEHFINMQVVNITVPANYFHCLRRQLCRQWRKPLVVMSPKLLLRHKSAVSSAEEFTTGGFQRLIPDTNPSLVPNDQVRRVLFCSGKVYYDLEEHRAQNDLHDVAVVRLEQLAPFPFDLVAEQAQKYPNADVVWCQEEPKNAGGWTYVRPRFDTALRHISHEPNVRYAGRGPSAAPATGSARVHALETRQLLSDAFGHAQ